MANFTSRAQWAQKTAVSRLTKAHANVHLKKCKVSNFCQQLSFRWIVCAPALTITLQVASVGLLPDNRIRQIYENYNKHNQLKFPSFLHIDSFLWREFWLPLTSFLGFNILAKL